MKKIELKCIDEIGLCIEELEILIYLSHLVFADNKEKNIREKSFEFTSEYAQTYLNDLLTKVLEKFKNAYSGF